MRGSTTVRPRPLCSSYVYPAGPDVFPPLAPPAPLKLPTTVNSSELSLLLLEHPCSRPVADHTSFLCSGTELDWSWETTSGKRIGGGRTLGGSSSINGAHYTRGEAAQYDAWSTLLNDSDSGWGWDQMFEHMKKVRPSFRPRVSQSLERLD
jgi:choline dehydrogenase-like flavoprotein